MLIVVPLLGDVDPRPHRSPWRGDWLRLRRRLEEIEKAHLEAPRRDQLIEPEAAIPAVLGRGFRGEVLVGCDLLLEIVSLSLASVGADSLRPLSRLIDSGGAIV